MRKALIGLILAATAATPVMAQVSDVKQRLERLEERAERRQGRQAQQQSEQRQAQREERQAQRAERRERRQATPAQQPVVVAQADRRGDRAERRERRRDGRPTVTRDPNGVVVRQFPNGPTVYTTREDYREERRERRADRRDWREDRRDWRQDRRNDRRWDRSWRNDRRYDWQRYRYANRHLYRPGRYYSPYRNHSYSRFSIGLILGAPFYSRNYWISDPWQYRLPAAYPGTRWVRYYDDVLLVDVYTGEVVDVIHDFFW